MATNHDDQLGEIYQTMLNELNCTFGVSFSRFHCRGHHGHGLVAVVVCGRHGIGLNKLTQIGLAKTSNTGNRSDVRRLGLGLKAIIFGL